MPRTAVRANCCGNAMRGIRPYVPSRRLCDMEGATRSAQPRFARQPSAALHCYKCQPRALWVSAQLPHLLAISFTNWLSVLGTEILLFPIVRFPLQ